MQTALVNGRLIGQDEQRVNLRELLSSRMSHEQVGMILRLADWVLQNPGEPFDETTLETISGNQTSPYLQNKVHDLIHSVGGPRVIDFSAPMEIQWEGAKEILTYRGKPRRRQTKAPGEFTREQWQQLWEKIWRNRPWLIFPGYSETMKHCHPRWVRKEAEDCLAWFQSSGKMKTNWVMTAYVWICRGDDRELERSSSVVPNRATFYKLARAEPDRFWPEIIPRSFE